MNKMQDFTYHTHTTFSDGANSVEEMIAQAVKLGFKEYGITDHLFVPYNGFDAIKDKVKNHILNIRRAAAKAPIKVLVGFEVDYNSSNEWLEQFRAFRKEINVDYLISGNHQTYDPLFQNSYSVCFLSNYGFSDTELHDYICRHFKNIVNSIYSREFDFVAHLDFIRWSGIVEEFDYRDERMEIVEALAKTNTPFELNTKGLKSIGDYYPARWMLEELKAKNVPVLISDDAHHLSQIGRYFNEAEQLLSDMNYTNRFKLTNLTK